MPRSAHLPSIRGARALAVIVGIALLMALTPPRAHADDGPEPAAVDRWIADYARVEGLPGIAVAVVKDGEIVIESAHGGSAEQPITARTPMRIGSVSKMITAFAVLQLVDQERLALDDPIVRHLPEFALDDPRAARITVRQVLAHTSGLPNPTIVPPADSPEERVGQFRDLQLTSDPGTTYAYSNLNYHTAARLIEVVSGQDFAAYLDDHVFGPIGMRDTFTVITTTDRPGLPDGHVTAYGTALALPEMVAMNAGAGGVISTAHDMALWLAMQQRGGLAADGTRVLSTELVEEARRPQPGSAYGLGWQHTSTSVPARIGHDGSLTRYSARAELVPSSGYGVAVLLNSYTPLTKHPFEIAAGIVDLTEGRTPSAGAPVATIVDGVLGLLTVLVVALGVRGLRRSASWATRRAGWPAWRLGLRLLPQLILPAIAVVVFAVLPRLRDNTATPLDAFGLWPAAMILLLAGAVVGVVLTTVRLARLADLRPVSRGAGSGRHRR